MKLSQRRETMPDRVRAPNKMLRTGEACRILCIHANTLRRWSEQGVIKAYRVGPRGDRRFSLEEVSALLIEHTKDGSTSRIKPGRQ